MTKIEMVGSVLHTSGFNASLEVCKAFARSQLRAEAGSDLALAKWDTQINDAYAKRYIAERAKVVSVRWDNLYKELLNL